MENEEKDCPVCGMQMDDNHFAPVSFPGMDGEICCNCGENLFLMFTNFEEKPGAEGYLVPDYSDHLEQITGRSYLENRLIYFQDILRQAQSEKKSPDVRTIEQLTADIKKITLVIEKGDG